MLYGSRIMGPGFRNMSLLGREESVPRLRSSSVSLRELAHQLHQPDCSDALALRLGLRAAVNEIEILDDESLPARASDRMTQHAIPRRPTVSAGMRGAN